MAADLESKIANSTAHVAVIGLGYVGLPLAVSIARAGFRVVGIDTNQERVDCVQDGASYIDDVTDRDLGDLVKSGRLRATSAYEDLTDGDVIVICVPTPLSVNKEPDLGPIDTVAEQLARYAPTQRQYLVILQSTTFPGTTEELILPRMARAGLQAGKDFYLAFSPERIDPGNRGFSIGNIPIVVGGVTPACTQVAARFLSTFVDRVIPVSSPKVAEMTKLLENVFRCVNIALVNELMMFAERIGIDIWEVIDSASTKPFGFMPFYPGPGVGGHCIPVDPVYLAWKAKEYDVYLNFIQLAAQINDNMPYYVASRIAEILSERDQGIRAARLLLLGLTFKQDVADTRNSPAVRTAELLALRGALVTYNDPYVPHLIINGTQLKSVEFTPAALQYYDAVIILVPHSCYNIPRIASQARLVIDTRNATGHLGRLPNVIRIGAGKGN